MPKSEIWMIYLTILGSSTIITPFIIYKFGLATKKWVEDIFCSKLDIEKEFMSKINCEQHQKSLNILIDNNLNHMNKNIEKITEDIHELKTIMIKHITAGN